MSGDDLDLIWRTFIESVRLRRAETGRRFGQELPDRLTEQIRREWTTSEFELSAASSPAQTFVARMMVLSAMPATPIEALENDLDDLLHRSVSEVVTTQPTHVTKGLVLPDENENETGRGRVPGPADESEPRARNDRSTPAKLVGDDPLVEHWDSAGLGLLIQPVLGELSARCEQGANFDQELEGLIHAAFKRTYGPSRERLVAALEHVGPFFAAWFGVTPHRGWFASTRPVDDAWLEELIDSLPQEWGEPNARWSRLVFRAATVEIALPYVDLCFPMHEADIDIRKRGWDIDPGWVPELGRVLRFRYEETT